MIQVQYCYQIVSSNSLDIAGTRTTSSKQTAKSKYNKYLMVMGEILSRE